MKISKETMKLLLEINNAIYDDIKLEFLYHSNKLEGSTFNLEQLNVLLDEDKIIGEHSVDDVQETINSLKLFDFVIKTIDEELTPRLLKEYHSLLKSNTIDSERGFAGVYKKIPNKLRGIDIETAQPYEVEEKIEELLNKKINSIEDIADFHQKFEHIHPFQDGNGRIGRYLILRQCIENNIDLIAIDDEYNKEYKQALYIAQKDNNISPLVEILNKCQTRLGEKLSKYQNMIEELKNNERREYIMKFTILTENRNCNNNCINEDGLSILIEMNNHKVLLDTGITDAFLKNAETLGINLDEVNIIALSHGHWDHGNGLKYVNSKKTLILHPKCYTERYSLMRNMAYAGINETKEELQNKFELIETVEPYKIFENVWFLGQIDRKFKVPVKNLPTILRNEGIDYLEDDCGGIVVKLEKGIIIFSSCSHSGVNNIIEQAKEITGEDRIIAVVGGFHLKEINPYTQEIVQYFKDNKIERAYMGHCTSDEVIEYFKEQLMGVTQVEKLFAGAKFEIN